MLHTPLGNAPKHFTPVKSFRPCYGTLQFVGLLLLLRLLFYNVIVKAVIFCRFFTVPCFLCHSLEDCFGLPNSVEICLDGAQSLEV